MKQLAPFNYSPEDDDQDHINLCDFAWRDLSINIDGSAQVCCSNDKLLKLESLDDIDDLWNGKILQALRKAFHTKKNLPAFCERCELFKLTSNYTSWLTDSRKEAPSIWTRLSPWKKEKWATSYMPQSISVNITDRCNLRCTMCSKFGQSHSQLNNEMDFELVEKVIRTFGPSCESLSICGDGEFMMHSRIDAILDICEEISQQMGRKILFGNTNGLPLVNQRKLERVISIYKELRFSVDTLDPVVYKQVRGGDIDTVQSIIKRCVRYKRDCDLECRIGISSVLMKETLPSLEAMADFAITEGLDTLYCQHILPNFDRDVSRRLDSDPTFMAFYNRVYQAIKAKVDGVPSLAFFMPQPFASMDPMTPEDTSNLSVQSWMKEYSGKLKKRPAGERE